MKVRKELKQKAKQLFSLSVTENGEIDLTKVRNVLSYLRSTPSSERLALLKAYRLILETAAAKRTVLIESAVPLADEKVEHIVHEISKRTGFMVRPKVVIKPDLIGGVKVTYDDTIFDNTVKGKFEQIKENVHG